MDVSMAELKLDAVGCTVRGVQFERVANGWSVVVLFRFGPWPTAYLVDARDRVPRQFKSLDSAVRAVEACGVQVGDLGPASGL